jgi:hypothetical protein
MTQGVGPEFKPQYWKKKGQGGGYVWNFYVCTLKVQEGSERDRQGSGTVNSTGSICDQKTSKLFVLCGESMAGHVGVNGIY